MDETQELPGFLAIHQADMGEWAVGLMLVLLGAMNEEYDAEECEVLNRVAVQFYRTKDNEQRQKLFVVFGEKLNECSRKYAGQHRGVQDLHNGCPAE
jgi:hypothetical protein